MNDSVMVLDIGSAFTKVAYRLARPDSAGETVRFGSLVLSGEPDSCMPSTVILDSDGRRVMAGMEALNGRPAPHLRRFENWKRDLFSETPPPPKPSGWEALFSSDQMRSLVQQFGIPATELEELTRLSASARAFAGVAGKPSLSPVHLAAAQDEAQSAAVEFLKWLRGEVTASIRLRSPTFPDLSSVPVRVTVPAFAPEAKLAEMPGCRLLAGALEKSGWKLHPERPFISEPLANAIGVLTQGRNKVVKRKKDPGRHDLPPEKLDMPTMFGSRSPIVETDKNSSRSGGPHPIYRAFVVDVGAYTADFALVELNPNNGVIGDIVEALTVRLHSVPLGIFDLDKRVKAAFTPGQQSYISNILTPFDWGDIRKKLCSDRVSYRLADGTSLGSGAQRLEIDEELRRFGLELGAGARAFFGDPLAEQSAELIFTGGGMHIPSLRERVQSALEAGGHKFARVHFPSDGRPNTPGTKTRPGMLRLGSELARGGSAIGGASVFFEPCFQPD